MTLSIRGVHLLLYSRTPEADRAFFRDVLELPSIDIGHGWMIFGLPPAEAALHPTDAGAVGRDAGSGILGTSLYLMCDDVQAFMRSLEARGVQCGPVTTERWGIATTIPLPSGGALGLYQPTHPTALGL